MKIETEQEQYNQLAFYTLAPQGPQFIHQNLVDAYAAQTTVETDKAIKITFALVGLYLHIEKGQTGRQAQIAHMRLARRRKDWPRFKPPLERGAIRVGDVLAADTGQERDAMIRKWCEDVWASWEHVHKQIAQLCESELGITAASRDA